MEQSIKELRKSVGLTQADVSALVGIPLRTYVNYENDPEKEGSIKYRYIVHELEQLAFVDETHGILKSDDIVSKCSRIFEEYPVKFCYLFGSYAKGTATERSDVDLLVSADVSGIKFYGLVAFLSHSGKCHTCGHSCAHHKQLGDNMDLLNEVMKEGIRIYVQD